MKKYLLVVVIAFVLTAILTWPLLPNMASYSSDLGDYPFNIAQLWYNQDSIKTGRIFDQKQYLHGYQFYPQPYSFVFANNGLVPSIIFAPMYWISGNIVFSANFYTFLTFILSFLAAFYTFNYFVKNQYAAFVGAFIFTFNANTMVRFPQHLDVLGKYFLPLVFLFAYRFLEKPSLKGSLLLWLFFTLNALTNNYYEIFTIILLPILALPFLISHLRKGDWGYIGKLGRSGLIGLAFLPVLLYFNLPYLDFSQKEGVVRRLEESSYFSARINDYFASNPDNFFYGGYVKSLDKFRSPKDPDTGIFNYEEHTLFVGLLPLILLILGIRQFRSLYFYLLFILPFIFSFGPYYDGQEDSLKLPFYYLYEWVPVIRGIRSPTRFEFVLLIPFALIASFGALWLFKKWPKKIAILAVLAIAILTLENFTLKSYDDRSLTLSKIDQIGKSNLQFLEGKKTLHLPIFSIEMDDFGKNSAYLNWLTQTGERIVNGNTSYLPPDQLMFLAQVKAGFDEKVLSKLKALGVDYLVIHKELLTPRDQQGISTAFAFDKAVVFNQFNTVIIDLSKYDIKAQICLLERDFDIQLESSYAMLLTNKADCYLPSIYEDRYRTMNVTVDGQKKTAYFKMPIIVGPGEQVVLSEENQELRIE